MLKKTSTTGDAPLLVLCGIAKQDDLALSRSAAKNFVNSTKRLIWRCHCVIFILCTLLFPVMLVLMNRKRYYYKVIRLRYSDLAEVKTFRFTFIIRFNNVNDSLNSSVLHTSQLPSSRRLPPWLPTSPSTAAESVLLSYMITVSVGHLTHKNLWFTQEISALFYCQPIKGQKKQLLVSHWLNIKELPEVAVIVVSNLVVTDVDRGVFTLQVETKTITNQCSEQRAENIWISFRQSFKCVKLLLC